MLKPFAYNPIIKIDNPIDIILPNSDLSIPFGSNCLPPPSSEVIINNIDEEWYVDPNFIDTSQTALTYQSFPKYSIPFVLPVIDPGVGIL